jgi:hypothetical protein
VHARVQFLNLFRSLDRDANYPLPERLFPMLRHEIEVGSVLRYEYEGRSVIAMHAPRRATSNAVAGRSRRRLRSQVFADRLRGSVGGRWPGHVEHRERATVIVEWRAADDDEAERLVEAARRGVLLVDVDRQRPIS